MSEPTKVKIPFDAVEPSNGGEDEWACNTAITYHSSLLTFFVGYAQKESANNTVSSAIIPQKI